MAEDLFKKTLYQYPLRDPINDKVSNRRADGRHRFNTTSRGWDDPWTIYDNPVMDEDISVFQQSFLGLSIMDFSANLGFNSSASSVNINLIKDDANFFTPLNASGHRNAVTEGYHPWDQDAFPLDLINKEGNCKEGLGETERTAKDEEGTCRAIDTGVVTGHATKETCLYDKGDDGKSINQWFELSLTHEMGELYAKKGDIECFPDPGTPVFFSYYDGKFLEESCITQPYSSKDFCKNVFSFNGILSKYEKRFSSSGEIYSVSITDPRQILENTVVILDGFSGRTAPADSFNIRDAQEKTDDDGNLIKSARDYRYGWNGYYNIINVFGYYEAHGFGEAKQNEKGMKWHDKNDLIKSLYLGADENGRSIGYSHGRGILSALRLMLSGKNERYINDNEPYGGPIYYSLDKRNLSDHAPFSEGFTQDEFGEEVEQYNIHRYIVDLDDLVKLSDDGLLPPNFHIEGDRITLLQLIQQVCEAASSDFVVKLIGPREAAIKEQKSLNDPSPMWWPPSTEDDDSVEITENSTFDRIKDYSGIIKIIPLVKTDEFDLNVIRQSIEDSQKVGNPTGPFTFRENSTLVSANVGREFTDPVSGQMLFGSNRTRVVGVTPLGGTKLRKELWFNNRTKRYNDKSHVIGECVQLAFPHMIITGIKTKEQCEDPEVYGDGGDPPKPIYHWIEKELNNAPIEGKDQILKEYLPSIEMDGVTLRNQEIPKDEFEDRQTLGWNPYGVEGFDEFANKVHSEGEISNDFEANLPPVSNDDYLPWYWPQDYSGEKNDAGDPFQFNRINSKHQITSGTCDKGYCSKYVPGSCSVGDHDNKEDCEEASGTWTDSRKAKNEDECKEAGGEWTPKEDVKDEAECGNGWESEWTADFAIDSGYLDLFPCWGFEESKFESIESSSILDDIIDIRKTGKPIKGFFWDDDPYRDFHPTEGIFSNFEWWNPGLGKCWTGKTDGKCVDENGQDTGAVTEPNCTDESAGGISTNKWTEGYDGHYIPELENNREVCECNPDLAPTDSECYQKRNTIMYAHGALEFRPACAAWGSCTTHDGSEIKEIHTSRAGKGNNLAETEFGCTKGCFDEVLDSDTGAGTGKAQGNAIIAYYTEKKDGHEAGTSASVEDYNEDVFREDIKNGIVKLITSSSSCVNESTQGLAPVTLTDKDGNKHTAKPRRIVVPIGSGGEEVEASKANVFSGGNGLYGKDCIAVSHRRPHEDLCIATTDIKGEGGGIDFHKDTATDAKNAEDCEWMYGGVAKWDPVGHFGDAFDDAAYGKEIKSEEFPKPGYVEIRQKVKGICIKGEKVAKKEDGSEINDEITCAEHDGKMTYLPRGDQDKGKNIGLPTQPRTATIPIDLSHIGYGGGPKAEINGRPIDEFIGYYYATVTELRHAAVGKDEWGAYLREINSTLPCYMFFQNPDETSKWKDYCQTKKTVTFKSGASTTSLFAFSALSALGRGLSPPPPTQAVIDSVGNKNKEAALTSEGHICGDNPEDSTMTIHQRTLMEFDLAYKKVQELATQFYGRKYLVPLPFNPPTSVTCTNPEYKEKEDCIENGFDWGTHGLISSWFRRFGIGTCVDKNGTPVIEFQDKVTCEAVINDKGKKPNVWIEPVQEANKWEIVSAGWPGGDISFKFESKKNTGYPQNMNFWTDDGNLKSFALYPEKEYKRFAGDSEVLDFSRIDAEQIDTEPHNAGPSDNWGNKIFITTEVDPKTHWLPTRPIWEIHHQKQYYKFRAGDGGNGDPTEDTGGEEGVPTDTLYATIGPPKIEDYEGHGDEREVSATYDLTQVLDDRKVYIRDPGHCEGENGGVCTNVGGEKFDTEEACTEAGGTWKKNEDASKDECEGGYAEWVVDYEAHYLAYKPYALITLPAQVYYPNIDRAKKLNEALIGKFKSNDMCIPLRSGHGHYALLSAWLMGLDQTGIAFQQIKALAAQQKNAPTIAPDMQKSAFIPAAYKPWHAAIPQGSNTYKWGPWATMTNDLGSEYWLQSCPYGKAEMIVDEQLHPAAFSGETAMANIALARISSTLQKSDRFIETGNVTLSGFGTELQGFCSGYDPVTEELTGVGFPIFRKFDCEQDPGRKWVGTGENYLSHFTSGPGLGDRLTEKGPYITDMNVVIGSNGVNVTYNLSTQRRFGDIDEIQEERIRKSQTDILNSRKKGEEALKRTKRGIDQYKRI